MKKLQQLITTGVLILLFSISTFGDEGIIHPWKTDTPPPPPSATTEAEDNGIIHTDKAAADDPVTEIVLSMLPSVLALF
ncbi:MAG: hypothetical protein LC803_22920 [Acidobacteria bacterium]|nr:hypothetical protein [Acidobacteriota bacterium]